MSKFYIQSGYQGKEVGALLFNYPKESFSYSAIEPWNGQPIAGSVEFVEEYIGIINRPNYYPQFLEPFFQRKIWYSNAWPKEKCFIKPADRHKRFESRILNDLRYPRGFGGGVATGAWVGPYWCSEVVSFKEEWRYYVANGEVLAAYWYLGEEKEIDAPELNIDWPKDFSGAVDFGRLSNGEIALVENNLPYSCGWYGPHSEGKIYGEWLEKSWNYVLNSPNIGV